MDAAERLVANEAFERFDAQSKFAQSERALATETARAETVQVLGQSVFRSIDDAEIFAATAFNTRLDDSAAAFFDEAERFDDHAFAATLGVGNPPVDRLQLAVVVDEIDFAICGGEQEIGSSGAELGESLHVPLMVAVDVDVAFRRQQMKRCELQIAERLYGPAVALVGSDEAFGKRGTLT